MYKLCFFVPDENLDAVKRALFDIGVGKIGDYDCCCWQTRGIGQFRPLAGSNPHIGQQGEVEQLTEWKVEMVCADDRIAQAVATLKQAHPYEEVAYDVWRLAEF
ncbi:Nif3-like dinuclear metal center hexameric protein [Marinobacterium arenosum]|uniref:Nif3-like dinuclear metal center hexameric protein n=1 Tax=Marinobacterium arenosum TaxID=2862496 RepID=UPI001C97D2CC|nr:YqfO family protein [Marinobacterium arenosum]MBY4676134.1 YqfO family protein [Marinobacterium arenosum]